MNTKLTIKGSKSISIRAIFLSYLAERETGKKSKISNTSDCEDAKITQKAIDEISKNKTKINLKDCGTAYRFFTALKHIDKQNLRIEGSKKLLSRPIKELEKSIIEIKKTGKSNIKGNISSQFISAILITAPLLKKNIELVVTKPIFSRPYIDITVKLMKKFGIQVKERENKKSSIFMIRKNQRYKPANIEIEPEIMSLYYIIALMKLKNKSRKDFLPIIKEIKKAKLQKDATKIKIIDQNTFDMNMSPDLVPTYAILAAQLPQKTKIINIEHLKLKESDRIESLASNLRKIGVKVKTGKSFIEIQGPCSIKRKTIINPEKDHRIAMAFGILSRINNLIEIKDKAVVKKSYPGFWKDITKI